MTSAFQLYKDLDSATEAALRASIFRFGVLVPVVKDQHGNILDGHQRARIADESGKDYPVTIVEVADEAEAHEIARTLNEDRRAMPKAQRLKVVKALREEGHSLGAIAGAVGVGKSTVFRDLSTVPDGTVPDRITGLDGKSRPAKREPTDGAKKRPPPKKQPGLGTPRKLEANRVLGAVFTQLRGVTLALEGCDCSTGQAGQEDLKTLTNCIRVLSRLRRNLEANTNAQER